MASELFTNSTVIQYSRSVSSLSRIDGTMTFNPGLSFGTSSSSIRKIRVLQVSISSRIPNIYRDSSAGFNNGLIRITNDGGANWTSIQLPNGVYTVPYIETAINDVANGLAWYTNPADPAIVIQYNLATQLVYILLDSTKLAAPGQIGIDLSQSRIYEVLGYPPLACTFVADGTHAATANAQLDWVGNDISVRVYGIGNLSYVNGLQSPEICRIPLSVSGSVPNSYLFPREGFVCPLINTAIPNKLTTLSFEFVGSRAETNGLFRPVYLLDGDITINLQLAFN